MEKSSLGEKSGDNVTQALGPVNQDCLGLKTAVKQVFLAAGILFLAGCATTKPQDSSLLQIEQRAKVQEDGGVKVSVAVLNKKESRAIFGADLEKRQIQALWLKIENHEEDPYYFFQRSVDPNYFTPEEAAYINRYRLVEPGRLFSLPSIVLFPVNVFRYKYLNGEMREDFQEKGIHNTIILPGKEISGFMFTMPDRGVKKIKIRLTGEEKEKNFLFTVDVSEIKQDYKRSDFENRYPENEWVLINDPEVLKQKLEAITCCTTNAKGNKSGDPLNLVVIAGLQEMLDAFALADWDETEAISLATSMKMMKAFFSGSDYRYSPVSNLYYQGRKHDIAFQKIRTNIYERIHLRLWYTPMKFNSKPVWVGQVSRDIGIRATKKTWNFMTHQIDSNVDESRDYLFSDLSMVQRLGSFGYVQGMPMVDRAKPSKNLTGDPYFTDGLRLVAELTDVDAKPVFLDWDFPSLKR